MVLVQLERVGMKSIKIDRGNMTQLNNEQVLVKQISELLKGQNIQTVAKLSGLFLFKALEDMSCDQCAYSLASLETMAIKVYTSRFRGYLNEQ